MNPAQRDEGLRRVSTTTRLVAVGGISLAGVLTAYVAKAAPGRNLNGTSVSTGGDQATSGQGLPDQSQVQPGIGNPDDGAAPLVPADTPPVRGRGRSAAVSGGS